MTDTTTARLSPLFSWRSEICDSELTPTQRHVALTLSLHMNERGGSCFPSIATLAQETGLSYDGTRRALRALTEAGWLEREMIHRGGDKGTRVEYIAKVPRPGIESPGTEDPVDPGSSIRLTRDPESLSEDVNEDVSEDAKTPPTPPTGGSVEQALQSSLEFEQFWALYGRIGPKKVALACWTKARKKASHQEILDGLERWVRYWRSPGSARVKWPQGWLNEERWNDDPPSPVIQAQNRMTPGNQALLALLENHDQG